MGGTGRLAAGLIAVTLLSTGCIRAQVAAAVRSDDTVTGEVVIASVIAQGKEPGPLIAPATDLAARVRVQSYRDGDFAGSRLLFDGLTFEEFGRLNQVPGGEGDRLRMQLRRSGDLVLFSARVDLVEVPAPERADVAIRLSFPGRITTTDGQRDGNQISWRPPPGEITDLSATARFADPAVTPWTQWAALVAGLAGLVVALVMVLAFVAHRRSMRPMPRPS